MKCSRVTKKLSTLLDDEVADQEKHVISEHLEPCGGYLKEFAEISRGADILGAVDEVRVSPFFMKRLKQRITDYEPSNITAYTIDFRDIGMKAVDRMIEEIGAIKTLIMKERVALHQETQKSRTESQRLFLDAHSHSRWHQHERYVP